MDTAGNKNPYEQLHAIINDPNTSQELALSLRTDLYAEVVNTVTSDSFNWADRRVICELYPLVRALARST